jgi:hypothetical protein
MHRLEAKRREKETTQKLNPYQHYIKATYSQIVQSFLTNSQAKSERVLYIKRKGNYKTRLNLSHLSSRLRGSRRCGRGSTSAWRRH